MTTDGLSAADVIALTRNNGIDPATAAILSRNKEDGEFWDNPSLK